jgi:serine/threonine protein kinase
MADGQAIDQQALQEQRNAREKERQAMIQTQRLFTGKSIGDYVVDSPRGHGAFGTVFEVRTDRDEKRALKLFWDNKNGKGMETLHRIPSVPHVPDMRDLCHAVSELSILLCISAAGENTDDNSNSSNSSDSGEIGVGGKQEEGDDDDDDDDDTGNNKKGLCPVLDIVFAPSVESVSPPLPTPIFPASLSSSSPSLPERYKTLNTFYAFGVLTDLADCDGNVLKRKPDFQNLPRVIATLVSWLAWMHSRGFAHLDIKPGNILVKKTPVVHAKLADFTLTKQQGKNGRFMQFWNEQDPLYVTTRWYRPLELLHWQINYEFPPYYKSLGMESLDPFKIDVYSLAVSIMELICGNTVKAAPSKEQQHALLEATYNSIPNFENEETEPITSLDILEVFSKETAEVLCRLMLRYPSIYTDEYVESLASMLVGMVDIHPAERLSASKAMEFFCVTSVLDPSEIAYAHAMPLAETETATATEIPDMVAEQADGEKEEEEEQEEQEQEQSGSALMSWTAARTTMTDGDFVDMPPFTHETLDTILVAISKASATAFATVRVEYGNEDEEHAFIPISPPLFSHAAAAAVHVKEKEKEKEDGEKGSDSYMTVMKLLLCLEQFLVGARLPLPPGFWKTREAVCNFPDTASRYILSVLVMDRYPISPPAYDIDDVVLKALFGMVRFLYYAHAGADKLVFYCKGIKVPECVSDFRMLVIRAKMMLEWRKHRGPSPLFMKEMGDMFSYLKLPFDDPLYISSAASSVPPIPSCFPLTGVVDGLARSTIFSVAPDLGNLYHVLQLVAKSTPVVSGPEKWMDQETFEGFVFFSFSFLFL